MLWAIVVIVIIGVLFVVPKRLLKKKQPIPSISGGAVLITGASSGIGKDTALDFAKRGFRVFAGVRKEQDANNLRTAWDQVKSSAVKGGEFSPIIMDVKNESSIKDAASKIESILKSEKRRLVGLVNNAGVPADGPCEFMPLDMIRDAFEVNVVGQIAVTQGFLPLLRAGPSRIVNIGSIAGEVSTPFKGPYSASKTALRCISDALRRELHIWDIFVSTVEPGYVVTEISGKVTVQMEEMKSKFPANFEQYYGDYFSASEIKKRQQKKAHESVPINHVTNAIWDAVTSEYPETRYLVGKQAPLAYASSFVADVVVDRASTMLYWPAKYVINSKKNQ